MIDNISVFRGRLGSIVVPVHSDYADLNLVGGGEVTGISCGRFKVAYGCDRVELHNHVGFDGVNYAGKVFVKKVFMSCARAPYLLSFPANSRSSGFRLRSVMYVCSLVVSSGVIGSGGLGLHPLVIRAVIVFWSGWMSFACSPFSLCTSIGLSPVWVLMSILSDSVPFALATSIKHFSCVGGCMVVGSGV
jgi:hypothetical protein